MLDAFSQDRWAAGNRWDCCAFEGGIQPSDGVKDSRGHEEKPPKGDILQNLRNLTPGKAL